MTRRWGEIHMEPRVLGQPLLDLRLLVRGVVVADQMQRLVRRRCLRREMPARRSAARKIMDISEKKVLPRIRFRLDDAGAGPERRKLEDVFGRQCKAELVFGQPT